MSAQLLSSKIAIIEEEPEVKPIQAAPSADTLCAGVTERGPLGSGAVLCQSFDEFLKKFGGFTANADVAMAAKGFFDNGGTNLWVQRVVHYSDITNGSTKTSAAATGNVTTGALSATAGSSVASSAGPYVLVPGDTLKPKIDGGGAVTKTFTATPAARTAGGGPYVLSDNQTLTVIVAGAAGGGTQTVTFHTSEFVSIGAATDAEVAAVLAASLVGVSVDLNGGKVRITTDRQGTGANLNVTGGSANAALGFTTGGLGGGGNVSDITAVTEAEVVSLLSSVSGATSALVGGFPALTSNTTGTGSHVQFDASGTAQAKIGFDTADHVGSNSGTLNTIRVDGKTDGAYANALTIQIADASSGVSTDFNLIVLKAGVAQEVWTNLSMTTTDPRYFETIVNDENTGSDLVALTDLSAATPTPRPANGIYALAGGNDGLASLDDADYVGSASSLTGLRGFDLVSSGRILIVPNRATSAVQNAMITYCEATRFGSCFAVLDPPANQSATQIVTYVKSTASLKELSEFAAMYWPRIKVLNPSKAIFGNDAQITVAPSGFIAGVYARNDAASPGGVYEAPAGVSFGRIFGALGLEMSEVKDENKRDLVYPELINPIVGLDGLPIHMDGARTLKTTGPFPTIGERRGVIFIEQSLKSGLVFAKHRKIKTKLLKQIERTIRTFLIVQMRNDAFASDDPKTAFALDVSSKLNPPSEAFAQRVNARVGLATAKPAEFVVLRVGQDTRALEEELAAAA